MDRKPGQESHQEQPPEDAFFLGPTGYRLAPLYGRSEWPEIAPDAEGFPGVVLRAPRASDGESGPLSRVRGGGVGAEGSRDGEERETAPIPPAASAADDNLILVHKAATEDDLGGVWWRRKSLKEQSLRIAASLRKRASLRADRQAQCGDRITIVRWDDGSVSCQDHLWCSYDRTCPACARATALRQAMKFAERTVALLQANPTWLPWLVTLTVKNGRNLPERFHHLESSIRACRKRSKNAAAGKAVGDSTWAEAGAIAGGIEVIRGSGSRVWHPHFHGVFLVPQSAGWEIVQHGKPDGCEFRVDARTWGRVRDEWHRTTGDSFVVDVRPMRTALARSHGVNVSADLVIKDHLEVFKYCFKFGSMSPGDVLNAADVLRGRHMVRSYLGYRGLSVTERQLAAEPRSGRYQVAMELQWSAANGNYVPRGEVRFGGSLTP